ncbi:MAG: acetate kinase [Mycobacteriaceae bacterium]
MNVLVLNTGSSSVKWQVRSEPDGARLGEGVVERIGDGGPVDHVAAIGEVLDAVPPDVDIQAVGHRVVHGGERFAEPVLIDHAVLRVIDELSPLAPLHNPAGLAGIRAATARLPRLPQVAVFDTAFHLTLPERAWRYAVPERLHAELGVRRYGFHGISFEFVAGATATYLGVERFTGVIAHLGNGASACAVRDGVSVDTSMGMTPLAGLVMGTRSGDLDPGVLLHLLRHGYSTDDLDDLLNRRSGLLGLTGVGDMRSVQARADDGDHDAEVALDVAAYRLATTVAGYQVALGGMPALVLTGGIGEHATAFRARVVALLAPLGARLDPTRNAASSDEVVRLISTDDSAVPVLVVRTDEERVIAVATAALAGGSRR